jgi:PAS domain S-box-containing protein
MARQSILIAEDDGILAAQLEDMLSRLGYTVLPPVATGEAAVDHALADKPDLVIMDIELVGEMNGITAATRIRTVSDIPIIYLTGYSQDTLLEEAKLTTPYGYLIKPTTERELAVTVRMALYRHALDVKLRESEARLQLALRASQMGVWEYNVETNDMVWSPECYEIFGSKDFNGTFESFMTFLHPEDVPMVVHLMGNLSIDCNTFDIGLRINHPHDGLRWLMVSGQASFNEAGLPLHMIGIVRDVTEQKQTEEALRDNEEKYRHVFAVENDALLLFDEQTGSLLDVNDAACKLYGYTREELLKLKVVDMSMEPHETKKAINEHHDRVFPRLHKKKDGGVMPVDISSSYFTLKGQNVGLGAIRDITKLQTAEEELKKHRDRLEALVQERTHELETKSQVVEELNMALRVLLRQIHEEKEDLEERFVSNVKTLVMPYVEKIKKSRLNEQQFSNLTIMEANLTEIMSPFLHNVQQLNLTPRETQVANLIKDGKTTKEIADTIGVAPQAIDSYRNSIRLKLGLNKKKVNLQSYLQSLR